MNPAHRPYVIANFAITADGKISTRNHTPAQFSSAADKKRLLEIRKRGDAIMVGRTTLEKDTMSLTVSGRAPSASPLRVLISESGKINPDGKVFHSPGGNIVIFSTPAMPPPNQKILRQHPTVHLELSPTVELAHVLRTLKRRYGVRKLVCEGGAKLLRSFLELAAVDELCLTVAPRLFGGTQAPTLTGLPGAFLKSVQAFHITQCRVVGSECFLTYRLGTKSG